jgi:hypothetical protein
MEAFIISTLMGAYSLYLLIAVVGAVLYGIRRFLINTGSKNSFRSFPIFKAVGIALLAATLYSASSPANRPTVTVTRIENPKISQEEVVVKEFSLDLKEAEDKIRKEHFDSLTNSWRKKYDVPVN